MRTYQVPIWNCACGYSQDFEPTIENQNAHFNADQGFGLSDIKAGECPSCALRGIRNTELAQGSRSIEVLELSDLDAIQVDTLSGPRALTDDERATLAAQIQAAHDLWSAQ